MLEHNHNSFHLYANCSISTEGNGIDEDTIEMIKNSAALFIFVVIIFLLGFIYSISSITLIQRILAVTRTLWEALRTFLIWIVQFIIFYSFKTNNFLYNKN